mmetsp:Transcript_4929/g.8300  ORF Transcript_4929/g.8300 Transcript_4929/m.8300 type:complete len:433 (+) Transcript_4929:204-1502(+)
MIVFYLFAAAAATATAVTSLEHDLQRIVSSAAATNNCSVSLSVCQDGLASPGISVSVAGGVVDGSVAKALPSDVYAWGSVTKTITGAAIMRLVADGKLSLDDRAHKYIDPVLAGSVYPYTSLESLFSADRWAVKASTAYNATDITIRHLIGMNSGVTDYDTDAYRHLQYSHPMVGFSPLDILDFVHGPLMFEPGGPVPARPSHHHHFHLDKSYCSVNFILLGLVLSNFQQVPWEELDQRAVLPPALRRSVNFTDQKSLCSRYTGRLHAFDRASYAAASAPVDVSDVNCFGGWTAGNVMMSAKAAADWTLALYGPHAEVIPREFVQQMVPGPNESFYGLATFNLTGHYANGTQGQAWGHLGDTYGFTSVVAYFPWANVSIAVATNVESYQQSAPSAVTCLAYNRVLDDLAHRSPRRCAYVPGSYYGGGCQCSK